MGHPADPGSHGKCSLQWRVYDQLVDEWA